MSTEPLPRNTRSSTAAATKASKKAAEEAAAEKTAKQAAKKAAATKAAATKAVEEAASHFESLQLTEPTDTTTSSRKGRTRTKDLSEDPKIEKLCEDTRKEIIKEKRKHIKVRLVLGTSPEQRSESRVKLLLQLKELEELPPSAPKDKEMVPSTGIAYYMSGPVGAGKSYWYNKLFEDPENPIPHHLYNVDKYQEVFLEADRLLGHQEIGLTYSQKQSLIAKHMAKAVRCAQKDIGKFDKKTNIHYKGILTNNQETIVIDKPATTIQVIKEDFYEHLQQLGYERQYMFFIYRSLRETDQANRTRSRQVVPSQLKASWENSIKNVLELQELFGKENFYFINASKEPITDSHLYGIPVRTIEEVYELLEKNHPMLK